MNRTQTSTRCAPTAARPLIVTAAVLERRGRILLAQRAQGDRLGGKWEFPGGKRERGETDRACLRRELWEEFSLRARIGVFVGAFRHAYRHQLVELRVYRARPGRRRLRVLAHEAIRWVRVVELGAFDLADADRPVAEALAQACRPRPRRTTRKRQRP